MKTNRQSAIRDLLVTTAITNQDELRRNLVGRGFRVTQATLSRDIRELKLLKGPSGYALPDPNSASDDDDFDDALPAVADLLATFGLELRQAQNLLVLLTATRRQRSPSPPASTDEEWPETVGTIAGDNTVLIICPDPRTAARKAT